MITILAIAIPATACALVALGVWLGHGYGLRTGRKLGRWDGLEEGYADAMHDGWTGPQIVRTVDETYDDALTMLSGDDPDTAYEPADTSHHDYRGGGR